MENHKRLRSTPPSQPTRFLSEDMIFNILMRLPPKSLLRLRCVCKNWDSIIRSQPFILKYNLSRPQGFIVHFNHKSYHSLSCMMLLGNPSTLLPNPQIPFGVVRSVCNGILCITSVVGFSQVIYLCNPSIRKLRVLTTSSLFSPQTYQSWSSEFRNISIGLGFDSNTNDYKILRIAHASVSDTRPAKNSQAEVYSLSLDSWRRVEIPYGRMEKFVLAFYMKSIFVNGAFHLLAVFSNEERKHYVSILRFDVVEERFEEMKLPEDCSKAIKRPLPQLATFKGLLSVFLLEQQKQEDGRQPCYIWTMNQGFWSKQIVKLVEGPEAEERCGCVGDHVVMLGKSRICLVDPQSLQRKVFEITRPCSTHAYTESLALL